jgi:hypothetical protein
MKTQDFDKAFDDGEDIAASIDRATARRPNLELKHVNVDFPAWMVEKPDKEAQRIGVTRQPVIKRWRAVRLGGM